MSDLKPCPFCGGEAEKHFTTGDVKRIWYACSNQDCGAWHGFFTKDEWNTRHSDKEFLHYTECPACGSETANAVQVKANKDMVLVPREPSTNLLMEWLNTEAGRLLDTPDDMRLVYAGLIQAWEKENE